MRTGAWLLLFFSIVGAEAHARPLAEMVRDLNALQNRMAMGDIAARDEAARQFDRIEKATFAAEPDFLREERDARSAVIYLLCGGGAGGLRAIFEAKRANEILAPLLDVSLRYAEGDAGALQTLLQFDPRRYPAGLGGHLALVQAGGLIGSDNGRAIALLDLARLLLPGSLVEEAALRREISILDPVRESDKLGLLAVRYAAIYASSPFARQFWGLLPNMARGASVSSLFASRFSLVLDKAPAPDRTAAYLALARRALLAGKFPDAGKAVETAERGDLDDRAKRRVEIYRSALSVLEEKRSVAALRDIETKGLPTEDVQLVQLVASVGEKLARPIEKKAPVGGSDAGEKSEMATAIREALARTDELLKRADGK
ncbi:hypothetical protein [Methylocystis parvus]|uniref:Chemotaxis protein MotC n=1 Tax=Methylocystis parvus TaxID=134 RepID=A0A6B8M264_9HYPH|nr:hypothetical protein [Methylocystis parvus]QGM97904.1 hypothetical protein F7D14_10780 [Methylocystis parvus]WBK01783.1 hypothetical protein MMG94_08800 [Methylocystis parvus OBBP]